MIAVVWRLWPEAKIFSDNAFDDIAQSYRETLQDGHFLPHRNIERDIAEAEFQIDAEEYNLYLDETRANIPDPLPEDLEPEASKHG